MSAEDFAAARDSIGMWRYKREGDWDSRVDASLAALARLEARIAELVETQSRLENTAARYEGRAFAAEARVEDLEAELTEWRTSIATEALQARVEALTAALREIAGLKSNKGTYGVTLHNGEWLPTFKLIATAALAISEQATEEK